MYLAYYSLPVLQKCNCSLLASSLFKPSAAVELTRLGNFADVHALFFGHEAEHREDGETSVNTGAAVEYRQHDTVPCTRTIRSTLERAVTPTVKLKRSVRAKYTKN